MQPKLFPLHLLWGNARSAILGYRPSRPSLENYIYHLNLPYVLCTIHPIAMVAAKAAITYQSTQGISIRAQSHHQVQGSLQRSHPLCFFAAVG